MQNDKQNVAGQEDNDKNRQEPHNAVEAGKEAIEASKLNDRDKPAGQQRDDEAQDADKWRNEG